MKKFLLLFLLLFPLLSHHVMAEEIDGINYELSGDTAIVIKKTYSMYEGSVTIPRYVTHEDKYYRVTCIGDGAFYDNVNLEQVVLPNTMTKIGNGAFYRCSKLSRIDIPNSVVDMGEFAFAYCTGLNEVRISGQLIKIKRGTFNGCSGLTFLDLPSNVTHIGEGAFLGCQKLDMVFLRGNVSYIGERAFSYCPKLTRIDCFQPTPVPLEENSSFFDTYVTYRVTLFVPTGALPAYQQSPAWKQFLYLSDTEESVKKSVVVDNLYYLLGQNTAMTLPPPIEEELSHNSNYPAKVVVPTSITYEGKNYQVTHIGDHTFRGTDIMEIEIPQGVTTIGEEAFRDCNSLRKVSIPNSVTEIEAGAFAGCSKLIQMNLPNSVTEIGGWAFYGCSGLTRITIPNSVTEIGGGAFYGCSGLTELTIPNSVTEIGAGAFSYCSGLTELTIPNSVTEIGAGAFSDCSGLTELTIPNSVTEIGEWAFSYCSGLTELTIPNSVTEIGEWAFYGCSKLQTIVVLHQQPLVLTEEQDVFTSEQFQNATLFVPVGSKSAYQTAPVWSRFQHIVEGVPTGIQVQPSARQRRGSVIYHLNGTRQNLGRRQSLPGGLYIIDGNKKLIP